MNLVYQLVELAITLAQSELDGDVEKAIVAVIQKGLETYVAQTGQPLNPALLNLQAPL